MHDGYVAVGTTTDLRAHARELRRSWDTSFDRGAADGVRDVVADSWTRMLGAGIAPDRLRPVRALDDDHLDEVRRTSPLRTVLDDLRGCLAGLADDAEHILVVGDAAGRLLWIDGHERVLEQARAIDFVPGMDWTEGSAGTNAIGTALAVDHAVQIFSAEHFLAAQHPWWCSAAPIHDPVSGALLGVVDLSGPQRTAHPHSLALVMAAAALAERTLRHHAELAAAREQGPIGRAHPASTAPAERGRLRLLTRHEPLLAIAGAGPRDLSLRQAEALALLALHPDGLTAEQLTLHLYGDDGNPVTTRALLSRLREVAGPVLTTRPYRLLPGVTVDAVVVERLLRDGRGEAALAMYTGPLLEASEVPTLRRVRDELDAAVRRVAFRGGVDTLWRWLDTPTGRDDLAAVEAFLGAADGPDPRRPLADAQRARILADWGG